MVFVVRKNWKVLEKYKGSRIYSNVGQIFGDKLGVILFDIDFNMLLLLLQIWS